MERINGILFKQMLESGMNNLSNHSAEIDALNVFPVPDGDTGTNMKMTIEGGVNEVFNVTEPNIYEMSKKISRGMLMGARGNSGVILSQLFRGLSIGFEGKIEVDSIRLARAFQRGVEQAYKAVKNPVEGTILTVAKDASKKMLAIANSKMSINEFFREYLMEVKESINALEYKQIPQEGEALVVPLSNLKTKRSSPYGNFKKEYSYVIVINMGDFYDYYFAGIDTSNYGIPIVKDEELTIDSVVYGKSRLTGINRISSIDNLYIASTIFKKNENPCTCPSSFPVCVCGKVSKGRIVTKKPILPSEEELEYNSRSKSAKLRIFERR